MGVVRHFWSKEKNGENEFPKVTCFYGRRETSWHHHISFFRRDASNERMKINGICRTRNTIGYDIPTHLLYVFHIFNDTISTSFQASSHLKQIVNSRARSGNHPGIRRLVDLRGCVSGDWGGVGKWTRVGQVGIGNTIIVIIRHYIMLVTRRSSQVTVCSRHHQSHF